MYVALPFAQDESTNAGTEEHTTRDRIGYEDISLFNFHVRNLPPLVLKTRHLSDSNFLLAGSAWAGTGWDTDHTPRFGTGCEAVLGNYEYKSL